LRLELGGLLKKEGVKVRGEEGGRVSWRRVEERG
jgi:hypothetical protein